jgi:hypothetical protein
MEYDVSGDGSVKIKNVDKVENDAIVSFSIILFYFS